MAFFECPDCGAGFGLHKPSCPRAKTASDRQQIMFVEKVQEYLSTPIQKTGGSFTFRMPRPYAIKPYAWSIARFRALWPSQSGSWHYYVDAAEASHDIRFMLLFNRCTGVQVELHNGQTIYVRKKQ